MHEVEQPRFPWCDVSAGVQHMAGEADERLAGIGIEDAMEEHDPIVYRASQSLEELAFSGVRWARAQPADSVGGSASARLYLLRRVRRSGRGASTPACAGVRATFSG
jgi:hypothetical protein